MFLREDVNISKIKFNTSNLNISFDLLLCSIYNLGAFSGIIRS